MNVLYCTVLYTLYIQVVTRPFESVLSLAKIRDLEAQDAR
jgi:hypothetical protein